MTKLQMANVAMMNAVQQVLANHQPAWNGIKPIADEVAALQPLLDTIHASSTVQFQNQTNGYTSQKDQAMELMNGLGYKMGLKLAGWARKAGNEVALKAVSYSKSALERGSETEQISRNTAIAAVAIVNLPGLADYRIDAAQVTTFQNAIANAQSLSVTRDAAGSTRQAATESIGTTIKKAMDILNSLDPLMKSLLDETDKTLEDVYFAARKVIYHRGGVAKPDEPVAPAV